MSHTGQLPSVTISFNLGRGTRSATRSRRSSRRRPRRCRPRCRRGSKAPPRPSRIPLRGLGLILLMAIVVVYLVLGILYESYTQPLVILSGLPSAGFGALLTLLIFKSDLSLRVRRRDHARRAGQEERHHDGGLCSGRRARGRQDAARGDSSACMVRFRPIMMTTMCALAGTLPIAVGWGAGAESDVRLDSRSSVELLVSQLLTRHHTGLLRLYRERACA